MGRALLIHAVRRHGRSPGLLWLLGLCVFVSLLAAAVPVRFRDRSEVLLESLQSIQWLAGLAFAAAFVFPGMARRRFPFVPERWGVPAVSASRVVTFDALGSAAVLAGLIVSLAVLQIGMALVTGVGSAGARILIGSCVYGYVFSLSLMAWARLVGSRVPGIPGMLLLFGVAVAPQFVSSWLGRGLDDGWEALAPWKLALLAVLPPSPPAAEDRDAVGFLWMAGTAVVWNVTANLLISWSLEHLQPARERLDRARSGS